MNKKYDYYALTVRKCAAVKTYKQAERVLNDYDYYCNNLADTQAEHIVIHYEVKMNLKRQFNIHIHATLKVLRDKQVFASPKKGWSIRLELCKSLNRWNSYVGKQGISRSDILLFVKHNLDTANTLESDTVKEYVPNQDDIDRLEDFITNAPNYYEHIRNKKLSDI